LRERKPNAGKKEVGHSLLARLEGLLQPCAGRQKMTIAGGLGSLEGKSAKRKAGGRIGIKPMSGEAGMAAGSDGTTAAGMQAADETTPGRS